MTLVLADACIQAARTSNTVLTQLWIDGRLATFGFFDALSLYSTTLILMMARLLCPNQEIEHDIEAIETASNILKSMADEGNVPAMGYFKLLLQLQSLLATKRSKVNEIASAPLTDAHDNVRMVVQESASASEPVILPNPAAFETPLESDVMLGTNVLMDNPFLQEFLAQQQGQSMWQPLEPNYFGTGDSLDPAIQWFLA